MILVHHLTNVENRQKDLGTEPPSSQVAMQRIVTIPASRFNVTKKTQLNNEVK